MKEINRPIIVEFPYELFQGGEWKMVYKSVPSNKDRIRFNR